MQAKSKSEKYAVNNVNNFKQRRKGQLCKETVSCDSS